MSHTKLTYSICKRSCESNLSFCFDYELFPLNLVVLKEPFVWRSSNVVKYSVCRHSFGEAALENSSGAHTRRGRRVERSPALRNPLRLSAPSMFNSCWSPPPTHLSAGFEENSFTMKGVILKLYQSEN